MQKEIKAQEKAVDDAKSVLKANLNFQQTSMGRTVKPPEGIYDVLADSILNSIGASKVSKYADKPDALTKQIATMLQSGSKSSTFITTLDGITYTISLNTFAFGGAGFSGAKVTWKDKNNKETSGMFYWASSPTEVAEALSAYCLAAAKINKKAWEDAASKFLTGSTKVSAGLQIGYKLIEGINNHEDGVKLAKEIGTDFINEYGGLLWNNPIKKFIKDLPNGEQLIKLAELGNDCFKAGKKMASLTKSGIDLAKKGEEVLKDGNNMIKLFDTMKSYYGFVTKDMQNLETKLNKLEAALKNM